VGWLVNNELVNV